MSLAIAALVATGTTTVHRAEAASISYPEFFETLSSICSA
jgi:3-phosphoshikimate 1-carboxyvinyltransferase